MTQAIFVKGMCWQKRALLYAVDEVICYALLNGVLAAGLYYEGEWEV